MHGEAAGDGSDPFGIVGTIFERKYAVDRVVAHGGFGVVYQARHLSLGSSIALKLLKPRADIDEDAEADLVAQFLDEARMLSRLRHPSVVVVLDGGIAHLSPVPHPPNAQAFAGGVAWMALEWLDGETLRDELAGRRARGGRTPRQCLDLLRPVLEAMAAAHEAGIVHRDLKPSNIMLVAGSEKRAACVLDFGIAKMMDAPAETDNAASTGQTETRSRATAFTPASAAPEQLSGTRTGPPTDVFALALMITEVLVDEPALPESDANERYGAVFAPVRPTPRRLGLEVGAWESVLARALAVRPADRQANARTLLAELELTVDDALHQPIDRPTAPPDAASAPPAPRARRYSVAALATLATLAAAGSAVAIGARLRSANDTSTHRGAVPLAAQACSAKACTTSLGEAAVCARDRCVALASDDCVVRADPGDLARDDTVWIGSMFPRTGPGAAEYGVWNHHAMELARRDFAQVMGGVPAGRARPLAVLECDDALDAHRAAAHLTDDVAVPVVVGFRSGIEAIELANALFVPRGVLTLAATNTNPMLTEVPEASGAPHLVFRTTFSTADAATAVGALVHDVLEPELRAVPSFARAHAPLRLTTLRARGAAGADVADALRQHLRFNDRSALDNASAYQEISYEITAEDDDPELGRIADALLASRPQMIVYAGGRAAARGIVAPVERRWPSGLARPRWISISELPTEVLDVVHTVPAPERRFYGVTPLSDTSANARFVQHYRETFDEPVSRTDAPNSTYDAFYLVAFATYGIAAGEPVTGAALSRAIANLVPPGPDVEVGVPGIFGAYAKLASGGRIDLTGATGKMDFDLTTGESAFDHSILCAVADGAGHTTSVPSGLVYVAATRRLEGTLGCR